MKEIVVYRPGVDICPECDTVIYHKNSCVLGAVLRENESLRVEIIALKNAIGNLRALLLGDVYLLFCDSFAPSQFQ